MKNVLIAGSILFSTLGFAQKAPAVNKTEFSKKALAQNITSLNGQKLPISKVLEQHKGKILIIDFWASWCQDCILALPKAKELKAKNENVDFVYFSLDRSQEQWKRGLEKYEITGKNNYWFDEGWKNAFNNEIDLNWIPRFMVIDQTGKIAKYYAISPDDPEIQQTIDHLLSK